MAADLAFRVEGSQVLGEAIEVFENLGGLVADKHLLRGNAAVGGLGVALRGVLTPISGTAPGRGELRALGVVVGEPVPSTGGLLSS